MRFTRWGALAASIEGLFKNEPGGGMAMGVRDAGMELAMSELVMENCRTGLIVISGDVRRPCVGVERTETENP